MYMWDYHLVCVRMCCWNCRFLRFLERGHSCRFDTSSLFLVPFSNWSTLRFKGSKIKLSLILTKIELFGFFDNVNLNMYLDYFLLWTQFSSWSKSGSKIKLCLISTKIEYMGVLFYAESNHVFRFGILDHNR